MNGGVDGCQAITQSSNHPSNHPSIHPIILLRLRLKATLEGFSPMLNVRCKVWIERDGRPVFGEGRVALLEAIRETASLAAAARKLAMPYRTAWNHLNHMERAYGRKLVERTTGGPTGGGCRLTPAGQRLLRGYRRLHKAVDELLRKRAGQLLDPT